MTGSTPPPGAIQRRAFGGAATFHSPAMAKHDHVLCVDATVVNISLNTPIRNEMMMNIYVGNLPYGATEDELKTAFAAFGEVSSVNLITDQFSGQSKGFAFVEMADNASADAAIKGLNETAMGGRNLKVNQAKPRSERPSRGPRW
jgi:RNA recognition motif-containing protein